MKGDNEVGKNLHSESPKGDTGPERRNTWTGVGTEVWRKVQRGQPYSPPLSNDNNNNSNSERRKHGFWGRAL